ncbi:MAG: hypothetical protein ACK4TL_09250 [Hyphomicrobiaceae bacterium]
MARKPTAAAQAALDQAQNLIYRAWEAASAKKRIALAEKALAISPLCADAYVLLAEHAEPGSDLALDLWRRGVDAGGKAIGKAGFDEYAGMFWGFLETRPYMRARFGLARTLWSRGILHEAIDHLRGMLSLNPNDNQGARYTLAAVLVEAARDEELAVLLKQYSEDASAAWVWTAALAAFRRSGDKKESRARLAEALDNNPYVPAYILGTKRVPKRVPPYYSPGEDDEAIVYALDFLTGWTLSPGAIDWLRSQVPAKKPARRPPRQQ